MFRVGVLYGEFPKHDSVEYIHDIKAEADAWLAKKDAPSFEMIEHGVYTNVEDAVRSLVLNEVELVCAAHDACYHQVKARYDVFPSARASQAIAKCRKSHGQVRHGKAGKNLKRWEREKWKDKVTGKPCGHDGPGKEYCRPSKKVSKETPKMYKGEKLKKNIQKKQSGQRAT